MLNAKEAKQLYEESGAEVENYLFYKIEPEVIKAAHGGKRGVAILIGSLETFHHLDQVVKPLEKAVVEKLQSLGYIVKIGLYGERYIPRGLINENGTGPQHQNYGFLISW